MYVNIEINVIALINLCTSQVAECQLKLDGKRKDIDRLNEKEKALYANFQASLGENNKFAEFLTKVFKKKIKRAKKKAQTEEG